MTDRMIDNRIKKLAALEAQKKVIEDQIKHLKEEIQNDMSTKGVYNMETDTFIIKWTPVNSDRFDSASFKKSEPNLYSLYTSTVSYRRFSYTSK